MSLYGYPRETTPNADALLLKNKLIKFSMAYASHVNTNKTLSHAMTSADQYQGQSWLRAPSILNVATAAGIKSTWITNQQILGTWDNNVSVIASEADTLISRNKQIGINNRAKNFDGILLKDLKAAISTSNLIVLHLQGSHMSYCRRYPTEFNKFKNEIATKNEFGTFSKYIKRTNNKVLNCYDNSILYTDVIINDVVSLLKQQYSPASLLYFSDHAEDVLKNKAHNQAVFTYSMTEIPLLFWANNHWQKKHSDTWHNLEQNKNKVFTNDHIFETISGLLGINSNQINRKNDLSSNTYSPMAMPYTLLGKKRLDDKDNWHYWQQLNIKKIIEKKQCTKLLPHRTNSLGKIKSALSSGLCGIEIDISLGIKGGLSVFNIGHEQTTQTGATLEDILQKISSYSVNKIWLDIKGVNQLQIAKIIERLDYLNNKYNIKDKAIIETSFFGKEARKITEAGYHLSYYLKSSLINSSTINGEHAQKIAAETIKKRILDMKPSAISFDLKHYSFVKSFLEPLISESQRYHTWFPKELNLTTPNLMEQLNSQPYFNDKRIETILLKYQSLFSI